jgi:tetratricopeptide (TPR) repeat protein
LEELMSRAITALRLTDIAKWLTPAVAFIAILGVLALVNRSHGPAADAGPDGGASSLARQPASLDTQGQITGLQAAVRANPDDAQTYALLGDAYYQRARETGDPSYYSRADGAFAAALDRGPGNATAATGQATLALARHDFRGGLELARHAHELAPDLASPYAPLADAQIELGRYGAAARTLDRLVRLKPNLTAYARISYYRELHGDLPGALQAMRLAVSAGAGGPEGEAYVQSLLGKLESDSGRYGAAERAYREALAIDPGYPAAEAGLAGVEAGRGDFTAAIPRYRDVVERLPLPEYAVALGEAEGSAGRNTAARHDYGLVGAEVKLLRANGVNTDVDLALFEANHGNPDHAVVLGRRAWQQAPSVRSADAYSWALYGAGRIGPASRFSREAMRLGSRDPSFLYHAGMIARAAGPDGRARELLGRLLAQSPRFSPLYAPRAERALEAVR